MGGMLVDERPPHLWVSKEGSLATAIPSPNAAPAGASEGSNAVERGLDKPLHSEVLPGVRARAWKDDAPAPEKAAPAADPIVPAGVPSTAAVDAAASAVGTSTEGAPAPVAPEPFEFGGVKFAGRDKAEHSFKTLRGMYAAKEKELLALRVKALEYERELAHRQSASKTEVPATGKGNGQAAAAPTSELDQADTYAIYEVLKEKFGERFANDWRQEQEDKRVSSRVEKMLEERFAKLEERFAPLHETQAQLQEREELAGIFKQMATWTLPGGRAAYPEFNDERAMREIGVLWKNLGGTLADLKTPRGVHIAIATYRDAMANRASAASPKTPSPAAVAQVADPVVSGGGDPQRSLTPPAPVDPNDINARLEKADLGHDSKLGFRVRKF